MSKEQRLRIIKGCLVRVVFQEVKVSGSVKFEEAETLSREVDIMMFFTPQKIRYLVKYQSEFELI